MTKRAPDNSGKKVYNIQQCSIAVLLYDVIRSIHIRVYNTSRYKYPWLIPGKPFGTYRYVHAMRQINRRVHYYQATFKRVQRYDCHCVARVLDSPLPCTSDNPHTSTPSARAASCAADAVIIFIVLHSRHFFPLKSQRIG